MHKIKVLIVDDTVFMRNELTKIFSEAGDIEVVGTAVNGLDAVEKASMYNPDVITMDVDMPIMDGITSLKHIMIQSPTPIVMITSLSDNKEVHFESFRLGSVNVVGKPSGAISTDIAAQKQLLLTRVREAAKANRENIKRTRLRERFVSKNEQAPQNEKIEKIFIIGASQGGLNAFIRLGTELSALNNAVIFFIAYYSRKNIEIFSKRLDELVLPDVSVFNPDTELSIQNGRMYMISAEDVVSMEINDRGLVLVKSVSDEWPINHLMQQCAEVFGTNCGGILLTGNTQDGMEGLAAIRRHGGVTAIQSPESSLFGETMETARAMEIAERVIPLSKMAKFIIDEINQGGAFAK